MRHLISRLLGRRLQPVLIACFAIVAAVTVGLNTVVTLRVITDYLDEAMERRVARDMDLASSFYQIKLEEIMAISQRMAQDPGLAPYIPEASQGDESARRQVDQELTRKITVPKFGGTHLLLVIDADGNIIAGRTLSPDGQVSQAIDAGNWAELPAAMKVLSSGIPQAATEVIPDALLAQLGLDRQAHIALIETPKAAPNTFDPREGTAGLALTSIYPIQDDAGITLGAVISAYLFNNDFTLVDRIKEAAGIDTVTVFFGDLRVSTNVLTEEGKRAVGTRVSQDVYDVVLVEGLDYIGRAFVVNDWYITRYEPLRNHSGKVVGSLYVGALESTFQALVRTFSSRMALIALVSIILAGIVAVPIARLLIRPIAELVEANRRLAQGDMTARVQPYGSGELAELGKSFNHMAETLVRTQEQLLHKERLASMGQLAAGVAHEINNPLGTILLFSDVLYKESDDDDPRRDDLKMIVNETVRCKNIVADLLNFARQQEILAQEVDSNALLDKVCAYVSLNPSYSDVKIVRNYDPDLPAIQADPNQLEQVFVNLLNNAVEAMSDGGAITISTRLLDGSSVEIKIADTGCGIPEENLGRLFTPFFTTKALGRGTGLGLSIVYGIIKLHQGQIMVDSKVGQGTAFTIILPVTLDKTASVASNVGVKEMIF